MIGSLVYGILSGITTRIYPLNTAQTKRMPIITYLSVSNIPTDEKDGPSPLDSFRVQIDIFHTSYEKVQSLWDQVRAALDRYTGTIEGVTTDGISFLNENDIYEDEPRLFRHSSDWQFRIKRSISIT